MWALLLLMNGFRINEKTDQMRRERRAHQQSHQQNSTRFLSKCTPAPGRSTCVTFFTQLANQGQRSHKEQGKVADPLSFSTLPRS